MIHDIKYKRTVNAIAGRKYAYSAGIILRDDSLYRVGDNSVLCLHSINKKDGKQTTDLMLQIPKEDIHEFINALTKFI